MNINEYIILKFIIQIDEKRNQNDRVRQKNEQDNRKEKTITRSSVRNARIRKHRNNKRG